MRGAGSGVLIASRDEPPSCGAASRWTGHERSLDPGRDRPHHRPGCRRVTAGPGTRGTCHRVAPSEPVVLSNVTCGDTSGNVYVSREAISEVQNLYFTVRFKDDH